MEDGNGNIFGTMNQNAFAAIKYLKPLILGGTGYVRFARS